MTAQKELKELKEFGQWVETQIKTPTAYSFDPHQRHGTIEMCMIPQITLQQAYKKFNSALKDLIKKLKNNGK